MVVPNSSIILSGSNGNVTPIGKKRVVLVHSVYYDNCFLYELVSSNSTTCIIHRIVMTFLV